MNTPQNPETLITDLKRVIDSARRSEILLNANGGNSVLVVCNPNEEENFISKIGKLLPEESYTIIDLNKTLLRFVENNKDDLPEMFEWLKGSVNQIFKAPPEEDSRDLFKEILSEIKATFDENKVPVLINNGVLYGSGIDNLHLMEHQIVMKSQLPLVILYPAIKEGEQLMFLGKRPSSKYRCMIID